MYKILSVALLFVFTQATYAEDIWVAVSVYDGRNNGINEYNGLLDSDVLDTLIKKTDKNAMFKLSEVFWLSDDGLTVRMSQTKKYGRIYGYTNTIYFKQSAVVRLVELENEFIKRVLK